MNVQIDKLEKMLNKTHLEVVPSSNKRAIPKLDAVSGFCESSKIR